MQDGVREKKVKFTEVGQTLFEVVRVETLVLEIGPGVSFRWCNIVVTNYTSALLQGM